ncbi:hypothetical protein Zmor_003601 [Zophobas morio]|uniref:Uncharacterized protein n=1 Tax=Zophobas morio TaxID=2755281 RepID=A0AA38HPP0_9CUCU|nr:hypothetical protein Zmor_003601 [Zophobas morio]
MSPAATLKNIDKVTRHYVKTILHLHLHTPDNLIHAPLRDGGLGVTQMTVSIPNILLRRIINNLSDSSERDGVFKATLPTVRVEGMRKEASGSCRQVPVAVF